MLAPIPLFFYLKGANMGERHSDMVANVCDEMLDGTQATCRGPLNPRVRLVEHSSALVQRIGGSRSDCAQLADLMVACYHLGKQQALQRIAIGLESVAKHTPEPASAEGLSKDGRLIRPDRAEPVACDQDHDPYPNVPDDDEGICLGDEPRPPQGFPRGTPPPDTVENPARGA